MKTFKKKYYNELATLLITESNTICFKLHQYFLDSGVSENIYWNDTKNSDVYAFKGRIDDTQKEHNLLQAFNYSYFITGEFYEDFKN